MRVLQKEGEGDCLVDNTPATPDVKRIWPLGIFLSLSAALSWTVWLWPIDSHKELRLSGFGFWFKATIPFLKISTGSCLPGVLAVIWTLCEGKGRFRRMLSTLTKWRTPLQWYVVAVALPLAVFGVALSAVLFCFPIRYSLPSGIEVFLRFVTILPLAPLWEELAWRAFALRKLETRYSRLVSALLLGVYWGMWHIPFWRVQLHPLPISVLLAAMITVIALSVIFAYLYHCSSESLPVVILLHAMYDACGPQASRVVSRRDLQTDVIYASTVLFVCLAVAFGRALWRMGDPQVDGRNELH
jgi:membrane protease YdiL (CAAX protease family)